MTSFVVQSAQRALDQGADLSGMPWITVENGKITALDLAAHARYATRMKQLPAFDQWDLKSPENELFGTTKQQFQHFTEYGKAHSTAGGELCDSRIVALMNPLTFAKGDRSQVCRHWRIRFGTLDRDTSMAVSVIFAAVLRQAGFDVDYFMPWEIPHAGTTTWTSFSLGSAAFAPESCFLLFSLIRAERPRGTKSCGAVQSQAVTGPGL